MKLTRLILVCTLLLLASSVFALPVCKECLNGQCVYTGDGIEVCFSTGPGMCDTKPDRCSTFSPDDPVMSDWTVASIEITRPAPAAKTVPTAPAAPAEVPAAAPAATK
jgi:hypothetical protein